MKIIYHIVVKELIQIRRDRRMLGLSIMAPILMLGLLGYAATMDIKSIPMVVCDQDKTDVSRDVVTRFTTSGYFTIVETVDDQNAIVSPIEKGNAWLALVIPPKFSDGILAKRAVQVQIVFDGSDANSANISLGYASQILNTYSRSIVLATLSGLPKVSTPPRLSTEVRVWYNEDLKSRNFMIPGVVAMVLMIITLTFTSLGVVREKEAGTLEQLLVTPIKPYQLIIGKLLPFVLIAAVDVAIVLAIARYWFDVPMRGSVWLMFAFSGLFVLSTLGLGLFVSTVSRTQQQAMMTAQFFFFMPFIFLSGFTFPIESMPRLIQYLTYIIPLRYFIVIIRGIFLKGIGFAELWDQALALLVFGVVILTLAVMRFRRKLG